MNISIIHRKEELFKEARRLRKAIFLENEKKGNRSEIYARARELQRLEDEVWKRKMFFENFIKEMEKQYARENKKKQLLKTS